MRLGTFDNSEAQKMADLIFWTVALVAMFFGFRWLQKRNKK